MGSIDNVCGFGGSIGLETQDSDNRRINYFAEFTGEGVRDYNMVKFDTSLDSKGNVKVGTEQQIDVD